MSDSQNEDQAKQHAEFVRLFLSNEIRIYGYLRSLVPHRPDAENLLQETAIVLWEKFADFEAGTDFARWAIAIARYQVLHFRRQQRQDVLIFSDSFVDLVDHRATASADALNGIQAAFDACLAKLSETDRELFTRRYAPNAHVSHIATELGRPLSTVYYALDRIHRALAECIEHLLAQEGRA